MHACIKIDTKKKDNMQKISEVITPHIAVSNTTIQANSIVSNLVIDKFDISYKFAILLCFFVILTN